MVEPVNVPDKLKKSINTLKVLTKAAETIKKEKEKPAPVPLASAKSK